MHNGNAQNGPIYMYAPKTANINEKSWQFTTVYIITLQYSDISAMRCDFAAVVLLETVKFSH